MIGGIGLSNLTIDCKEAVKLRDFYAELLGWQSGEVEGFPVLHSPYGMLLLFNKADFDVIAPVWPEEAGKQQKHMHFDFHVDDLAQAVLQAEKAGAKRAEAQYGGQRYVTMLDPEGHPFCLCKKDLAQ